jgi:hypothetical protein
MSRGGLVFRQSASGVDEPTCGWCGCERTQCDVRHVRGYAVVQRASGYTVG